MITMTVSDRIGTITLDRPSKLNALTTEMLVELNACVGRLVEARVSVLLVRSSSQNFSAGADLGEWAGPTAEEAHDMSRVGVDAFAALAAAPMPSLAVIDGIAAGGGLELALACDLRIATTRARLGMPETGLANLPAYGGISRLVEIVGAARARELLFTADLVDGPRAGRIGLVNWVVEPEDLDAEADRIASRIAATDAHSTALAKALVGGSPVDGLLAAFTSQSDESRRRKQAFLQRRAARTTQTEGADS